jgi:hypothetical protein
VDRIKFRKIAQERLRSFGLKKIVDANMLERFGLLELFAELRILFGNLLLYHRALPTNTYKSDGIGMPPIVFHRGRRML